MVSFLYFSSEAFLICKEGEGKTESEGKTGKVLVHLNPGRSQGKIWKSSSPAAILLRSSWARKRGTEVAIFPENPLHLRHFFLASMHSRGS